MSFRGVLVPVCTPFAPDLTPDSDKFIAFCKALLEQGAAGLAVFGTTSEANSIGADERMRLLEELVAAGVPAQKLMPGTGACSITEAITLTRHAVGLGCGGSLLLPPFYYKGVPDDGIFSFVECIIQAVGDRGLKLYLYHIPPLAQVGYSVDLVGRLHRAYPDTVVGLNDSSGDWSNTEALIKAYPQMEIFPGSEIFLLDALRIGGAGCITATANINARMISASHDRWQDSGADLRQQEITRIRTAVQSSGSLVPVIKGYISFMTGDRAWSRRVPTVPHSKQPRNAAANSGGTVAARHDFRRVSAAARRLISAQTVVKRTASALGFRPSRSSAVPSALGLL